MKRSTKIWLSVFLGLGIIIAGFVSVRTMSKPDISYIEQRVGGDDEESIRKMAERVGIDPEGKSAEELKEEIRQAIKERLNNE